MKKLPFKPGGRRDPWREFWHKEVGIYVQICSGINKVGTVVGVSIAWTIEEMLPEPWSHLAPFRIKQRHYYRLFREALDGYEKVKET